MAYATAKLLVNGNSTMGLCGAAISTVLLALPSSWALDLQLDAQTGNIVVQAGQTHDPRWRCTLFVAYLPVVASLNLCMTALLLAVQATK